MSHDHDLDALEARGTAAGADLRARAASRPVPAFDPDRSPGLVVALPSPARRGRTLAAVAAAVVLVAGGAAWWTARPERGGTDTADQVVSGDPRPFVATDLPKGLDLSGVADLGSEGDSFGEPPEMGPMVLYGTDLRHPTLGLVVQRSWDDAGFGDDVPRLDLDGVPAYRLDGSGLGRSALAFRSGDQTVFLLSSTVDGDELQALVPSITVDGLRAEVAAVALPDGVQPLGELGDGLVGINPTVAMRGGDAAEAAHSAFYVAGSVDAPDGENGVYATVTSTTGGEAQVYGVAIALDDREDLTVQGHDALLGRAAVVAGTTVGGWTVSWSPRPGEVVRVAAYGLDRDQVLALAEGVVPASSAEWRELIVQTQLGELREGDQGPTVGEGTFEDGTRWILRLQRPDPDREATGDGSPGASLSVALDSDGSSSYSTSVGTELDGEAPPPSGILSTDSSDYGARQFLAGLVAPDVAALEVRTSDGTVVARPTIVEGAGQRGYVVELPGEGALYLVARDDAGGEVETQAIRRPDVAGEGGSYGPAEEECAQIVEEGGSVEDCQAAPEPILPGD